MESGRRPVAIGIRLLEGSAGLSPILLVLYLLKYQDQSLKLEDHLFHEVAIFVALLEGAFISFVSWRCYSKTGEVFVKWLTLGFIGFTTVYSLHGVFTPISHHNIWLFLLYGPDSRVVLAICLFISLLKVKAPVDSIEQRESSDFWQRGLGYFLVINIVVAFVANSQFAGESWLRYSQELFSVALCATGIFLLLTRNIRAPLMVYFGISLGWFAISSIAFILAKPWNHLWWVAHAIFAGGFSILGYGVLKGYLAARSFAKIFSQDELFEDLAETNQRLKETLAALEVANQQLDKQMQVSDVVREQYLNIFNSTPDGVLIIEEGGKIVQANPCGEAMFGYEKHGLIGVCVEDLMPPNFRKGHVRLRKLFEYSPIARPMGSIDNRVECLRRDGSTFYASISIGSLVFDGAWCAVTFIRDLSHFVQLDQKKNTLVARANDESKRLAALVDLVPFPLFQFRRTADGKYEIPMASTSFSQQFDLTESMTPHERAKFFLAAVMPTDAERFILTIENASAQLKSWKELFSVTPVGGKTMPHLIQMGMPEIDSEGGIVWTAYIRCTKERASDSLQK
jgi:PAS domain S-box-containing protein